MCVLTLPPLCHDSGVSQELRILIPWSHRFLDAKTLFVTLENKNTEYYLQPEAIAFNKNNRNFQMTHQDVLDIVYVAHLPITVQMNMSKVSATGRSFSRAKGSGRVTRENIHNLIIARLTGVREAFNASSTKVSTNYSSDYECCFSG